MVFPTPSDVDSRIKRMTLRTPNENEVIFIGERSNHLSNVISAATSRKKLCEKDVKPTWLM